MKRTFLYAFLILALAGVVLTGCNKETGKQDSDNKQESNNDAKEEVVDISKQSPEDVVINIYGTEVPLVATKEEILEIGKAADWMIWVSQQTMFVDLEVAGWSQKAPGFTIRFKDGADASASKVSYEIEFNSEIDWDKVEIYGMDAKAYIDNYEMNTNFYEDLTEELRLDVYQYELSLSVYGDTTYTEIPEDEYKEEIYGYEKFDFTTYGTDEYVNQAIKAMAACDELMNLEYFYRNEMVEYIFQRLKTYEFGHTVCVSKIKDGSTVVGLLGENDEYYAIDLKHNFTGETIYIRDEKNVMEEIAEAEWDAIHDKNYDKVEDYEAFFEYMRMACDDLKLEGKITGYEMEGYQIKVTTAKGVEYQYTFGNPHRADIMEKVFENLNSPDEEYSARREE